MASDTRPGPGDRASLLGTLLEQRYRVDALLARGGMSTVYRGLDTRLDRPVAIKVMDAQYSGDRSFVERFEREARAAARLDHPNIVGVYDQGVDRGADGERVFLVMQLVRGCTLRDLIHAHGSLDTATALSVLEPVLSALSAAHQAEMVHRDVKPENVLIGTDGTVQVADFGLVRAAASAGTTSGSVILGTVAYLSPEQVTTGDADARSDVYAAGIVLYEMLTGQPPYVADNALSIAYRHVNEDVPSPSEHVPDLPPALDELVRRATRRDPTGRPVNAAAFAAELRQLRARLGLAPVTVSVPVDTERTEQMAATPVPADPAAGGAESPGPRGTRALARPPQDGPAAEQTQELSATSNRSPRHGKRRAVVWTSAIVMLAALLGVGAFWLGSASPVDVPPVVGQQEDQAQGMLRKADLSGEISREHNDDAPKGVVFQASPRPGTEVRSGSSVDLVVSQGKPQVPDIKPGTSVDDAESVLRNAKLRPRVDDSHNQFHPKIPEGKVITVDPGPGSRVATSSAVTIVASKGPPPIPVPDLRGSGKDEAFSTLRGMGFEPYEAEPEFNADVDGGNVARTEPAAGTKVRGAGSTRVGVHLSNAVSVPRFTGSSLEDARSKAAERGLQLEVHSLIERPNSMIFGQEPKPSKRVKPGSTIQVNAI